MDTHFHGHPYSLLFNAFSLIPLSHYFLLFSFLFLSFLYNLFDFHFFRDLFFGLRGSPVSLHYHPSSPLFNHVVSRCKILHRRYLATPWLSSPHLQTCFLNFFGNPPSFTYTREIFHASDGGTIALDWLLKSDVFKNAFQVNNSISEDDATPIVLVVPGLTSDSASAYLKHLAFNTAKNGWNVVVSNHRGLGGVSVTSDCFYNAGWTEDVRAVARYLKHKFPMAPLFAVGTSIGANVLVKYLGEDKELTPIAGAAAICNPWDLVIGDRFISRRLVQRFYDRALAIGLQGYAQLHEPRYSQLANWEGIKRSCSIRDFDHHATCPVGKFETVDTYYRRCSSAYFVGNVSVPLLCISALDDPLCTREAIPWDECRANKNIVLATTQHGGHLAFFEGLLGSSLWWVRAVNEFLGTLQSSSLMHVQKNFSKQACTNSPSESTIDRGPYVSVTEDGMVAAAGTEQTNDVSPKHYNENGGKMFSYNQGKNHRDAKSDVMSRIVETSEQDTEIRKGKSSDVNAEVRRSLNQIYRQSRWSIWVIAFIAVVTSWPIVGSALNVVFRKKRKIFFR